MGLAAPGRLEPMSVSPERPDVSKLCTHPMTFAPEHQKTATWQVQGINVPGTDRYIGNHTLNHFDGTPPLAQNDGNGVPLDAINLFRDLALSG